MRTTSDREPGRIWYVEDPAVKTRAGRAAARRVHKWLTTGLRTLAPSGNEAAFKALHVCAHWASISSGTRRQRRLRDRWRHRWETIREHLVEANMGLVYSTIAKFQVADTDDDSLLSDAMFAMARAVDRFNPWRGFRFSTYACNSIIRACARRQERDQKHRQRYVQYDISMDRPLESPDLDRELRLERLERLLTTNETHLSDIEMQILAQRFPHDRRRRTFTEIGEAVGLSKERVRQIHLKAVGKLRTAMQSDPVLC